jgi:hypothetical protein
LFFEDQGSMHYDCTFDITDAVVFMILREVLTLLPLESSGYQCQDGIKHPQQYSHFSVSFLGDTQMLLRILQEVKASMKAKQRSGLFAFKPLKVLFLLSVKTMMG